MDVNKFNFLVNGLNGCQSLDDVCVQSMRLAIMARVCFIDI